MRELLEDAAAVVCSVPIVLGICALYWIVRLFGVDLGEDFL